LHRLPRPRRRCADYLQIAQLCIKAGADTGLISRWLEEGRRRAAAVRKTPLPDSCSARTGIWDQLRPELGAQANKPLLKDIAARQSLLGRHDHSVWPPLTAVGGG
jgi:hypothetical protein